MSYLLFCFEVMGAFSCFYLVGFVCNLQNVIIRCRERRGEVGFYMLCVFCGLSVFTMFYQGLCMPLMIVDKVFRIKREKNMVQFLRSITALLLILLMGQIVFAQLPYTPGDGMPSNIIFTTTAPDGQYNTGDVIRLEAEFDDWLGLESEMKVRLNTGDVVTLSFNPQVADDLLDPNWGEKGKRNAIIRDNNLSNQDGDYGVTCIIELEGKGGNPQNKGKFIIAGGYQSYEETGHDHLVVTDADGKLLRGFGGFYRPGVHPAGIKNDCEFSREVRWVIETQDGGLLIGGEFQNFRGNPNYDYLIKFKPDLETIDEAFMNNLCSSGGGSAPATNGVIGVVIGIGGRSGYCMEQDADGSIYVAGTFTSVGGVPRQGVVKLKSNGSVDTSFDPFMTTGAGSALLIDGDNIWVGAATGINDNQADGWGTPTDAEKHPSWVTGGETFQGLPNIYYRKFLEKLDKNTGRRTEGFYPPFFRNANIGAIGIIGLIKMPEPAENPDSPGGIVATGSWGPFGTDGPSGLYEHGYIYPGTGSNLIQHIASLQDDGLITSRSKFDISCSDIGGTVYQGMFDNFWGIDGFAFLQNKIWIGVHESDQLAETVGDRQRYFEGSLAVLNLDGTAATAFNRMLGDGFHGRVGIGDDLLSVYTTSKQQLMIGGNTTGFMNYLSSNDHGYGGYDEQYYYDRGMASPDDQIVTRLTFNRAVGYYTISADDKVPGLKIVEILDGHTIKGAFGQDPGPISLDNIQQGDEFENNHFMGINMPAVKESDAFITTWTGRTVTIPTEGSGYDFLIDWGDGTLVDGELHPGVANTEIFRDPITSVSYSGYTNDGPHTVKIYCAKDADGDGFADNIGFPRIFFKEASNKDKILTIEQWGGMKWKTMNGAFEGCINLDCVAPDTPNLTTSGMDLTGMFMGCSSLVGTDAFANWEVATVSKFMGTFSGAKQFNQPIGGWTVSGANFMSGMFDEAEVFNQDLSSWDVSNVANMAMMFRNAKAFNQPLDAWGPKVTKVTQTTEMFKGATAFNQDLSSWSVDDLANMRAMFMGATAFNNGDAPGVDNTPLDWTTPKVTTMVDVFKNASSFNQDISTWNPSTLGSFGAEGMLDNCAMNIANYDKLLDIWNSNYPSKSNVKFSARTVEYCAGEEARTALMERGWGDGTAGIVSNTGGTTDDIIDGGKASTDVTNAEATAAGGFQNETADISVTGTFTTDANHGDEPVIYYGIAANEALNTDTLQGSGSSIVLKTPGLTIDTEYVLWADNGLCPTSFDTITIKVYPKADINTSTVELLTTDRIADGSSAHKIKVTVKDVLGNLLPDAGVVFTETAELTFIDNDTLYTNASGEVILNITSTVAGDYLTTVSLFTENPEATPTAKNWGDIVNDNPVNFSFISDEPNEVNSIIEKLTNDTIVADGSEYHQFKVTLRDAYNNPVPNVSVTLAGTNDVRFSVDGGTSYAAAGTGVTSSTDSDGEILIFATSTVAWAEYRTLATFNQGGIDVSFIQSDVDADGKLTYSFIAGPPVVNKTTLVHNTKDNTVVVADKPLDDDCIHDHVFTATLRDANNNVVPNHSVVFAATNNVSFYYINTEAQPNDTTLFASGAATSGLVSNAKGEVILHAFSTKAWNDFSTSVTFNDGTNDVTFGTSPLSYHFVAETPDYDKSSFVVNPEEQNTGQSVELTVTLIDAYDNPCRNVTTHIKKAVLNDASNTPTNDVSYNGTSPAEISGETDTDGVYSVTASSSVDKEYKTSATIEVAGAELQFGSVIYKFTASVPDINNSNTYVLLTQNHSEVTVGAIRHENKIKAFISDQYGNAISGIKVKIAAQTDVDWGSGTNSEHTTITNIDGEALFNGISAVAADYSTLVYVETTKGSNDYIAIADQSGVDILRANPVNYTFLNGSPNAANSTIELFNNFADADGTEEIRLRVTLRDGGDNLVVGDTIVFFKTEHVTYSKSVGANVTIPQSELDALGFGVGDFALVTDDGVAEPANKGVVELLLTSVKANKYATEGVILMDDVAYIQGDTTYTFVPGPAVASNSKVSVSLNNQKVGTADSIKVELYDAQGNALDTLRDGTTVISFAATNDVDINDSGVGSAYTHNLSVGDTAVFNIPAVSLVAGNYSTAVNLAGNALSGSPALYSFLAGAPEVTNCSVVVENNGSHINGSGEPNKITATIKDADSNPVPDVYVRFKGTTNVSINGEGIGVDVGVNTDANGVATVTLTSTVVGAYGIHVSYSDGVRSFIPINNGGNPAEIYFIDDFTTVDEANNLAIRAKWYYVHSRNSAAHDKTAMIDASGFLAWKLTNRGGSNYLSSSALTLDLTGVQSGIVGPYPLTLTVNEETNSTSRNIVASVIDDNTVYDDNKELALHANDYSLLASEVVAHTGDDSKLSDNANVVAWSLSEGTNLFTNTIPDSDHIAAINGAFTTSDKYPLQFELTHPLTSASITNDVTVTVNSNLDYGDAPIQTKFADNGARHILAVDNVNNTDGSAGSDDLPDLILGVTIDAESDGQPVAAGADNNATNGDGEDEDGITNLPVAPLDASEYSVELSINNATGQTAYISAWLDHNRNNIFDSGERISLTDDGSAVNSVMELKWTGITFTAGFNYLRVRISSDQAAVENPGGIAPDGEVEDYRIEVSENSLSVGGNLEPDNKVICAGTSTTFTLSGYTGDIVQWEQSETGDFDADKTVVGSTNNSYSTDVSLAAGTYYYRVVVQSGTWPIAYSDTVELIVDEKPLAGTTTATDAELCTGSTAGLTLSGSRGNIQWQSASNTTGSTPADDDFSDITGASNTAYTSEVLSATTDTTYYFYRAVITNGVCDADTSNVSKVTVFLNAVGGTTSATDTELCNGSSAELALANSLGNIQWQSASNTTGTTPADGDFSDISGATNTAYTSEALSATTDTTYYFYRAVVINGVCDNDTSDVTMVTVYQNAVGGTISTSDAELCNGSATDLSLTGSLGNIQWQSASNTTGIIPADGDFSDISGATNAAYTSEVLSATTDTTYYFYRAVVINGVCDSDVSDIVTITVFQTSEGGSVTPASSVVLMNETATLNLSGHLGSVVRWETSTDDFTNDINTIESTSNITTYTSPQLTTTMYYRVVVQNGVCGEMISDTAVVNLQNSDFGDAPDTYGTTLANNGAMHALAADNFSNVNGVAGSDGKPDILLGAVIDSEGDGQPVANGVDNTGTNGDGADEDGISFLPKVSKYSNSYQTSLLVGNVTGNKAYVSAWLDYNNNGVFDETEKVSYTFAGVTADTTIILKWNSISFIPEGETLPSAGYKYLRVRVSTDEEAVVSATGIAPDGEVEDYRIEALDYQPWEANCGDQIFRETFGNTGDDGLGNFIEIQAPATTTYLFRGEGSSPDDPSDMGDKIKDNEYSITPQITANVGYQNWARLAYDHTSGDGSGRMYVVNADYDPGTFYTVNRIQVSSNTLYSFSAWLANMNQDIASNNSAILPNVKFTIRNMNGDELHSFETGSIPRTGTTEDVLNWAKYEFIFNTEGNSEIQLELSNAEVGGNGNDLAIDDISLIAFCDAGDLPDTDVNTTGEGNYNTLFPAGPAHFTPEETNNIYIGSVAPDKENDGQQVADAGQSGVSGDDGNGSDDDEDGLPDISFETDLSNVVLHDIPMVNNTGKTGYLCGWIDVNGDGDFDTGERVVVDIAESFNGKVDLSFEDFNYAIKPGDYYVRLRAGTVLAEINQPTGLASDGEVEDHMICVYPDTILVDDAHMQICEGSSSVNLNNCIQYVPQSGKTIQWTFADGTSIADGAAFDASTFKTGDIKELYYTVVETFCDDVNVDGTGKLYLEIQNEMDIANKTVTFCKSDVESINLNMVLGALVPGTWTAQTSGADELLSGSRFDGAAAYDDGAGGDQSFVFRFTADAGTCMVNSPVTVTVVITDNF